MHLTLWLLLSLPLLIPAFAGHEVQENSPHNTSRPSADYLERETTRLVSLLNSAEQEVRLDAVIRLSALRTSGAAAALRIAARDESEKVRAASITGLGATRDSSNAPQVAARLSQDKSALVRKSAAYALATLKTPESSSALRAALRDMDLEVRGAAAVALDEYGDPADVAALTGALSDAAPFVQEQAARALGRFGRASASAVPAIITLLSGNAPHGVRLHAAIALGQIGERSALPALTAASQDRDPYLSKAAIQAIKLIESRRE
jgi:HEAT repeat protein